jgi:hypothetical protein
MPHPTPEANRGGRIERAAARNIIRSVFAQFSDRSLEEIEAEILDRLKEHVDEESKHPGGLGRE